jgi:hypothetical protein
MPACRNIEMGRASISRIPYDWLNSELPQAVDESLDLDDEWEYRRLLELLAESAPQLMQTYIDLGLRSSNTEIQDAAAEFKVVE